MKTNADFKQRCLDRNAQTLIELTLTLFLCVLMIYGIYRFFDWSRREFTGRLKAHEEVLLQDCGRDGYCPMEQTRSKFFEYAPVNAVAFDPPPMLRP